jgi:hypothetical protein
MFRRSISPHFAEPAKRLCLAKIRFGLSLRLPSSFIGGVPATSHSSEARLGSLRINQSCISHVVFGIADAVVVTLLLLIDRPAFPSQVRLLFAPDLSLLMSALHLV